MTSDGAAADGGGPGGAVLPGLYVHVPFCQRKCGYCGFFSEPRPELIPRYLGALAAEAALHRGRWEAFDTVYVGGGTPTVLGEAALAALFAALRSAFAIAEGAEITVEANPGDLTGQKLLALRGLGVTRLSVGVQSFDDRALSFLGRRHTAAQAAAALVRSRAAGFDEVGIDLIWGLPGQTAPAWMAALETALTFAPEHLSCYQLTVEPATPLAAQVAAGEVALPGEAAQAALFLAGSALLSQQGFEHYEVSNFARGDGRRSRHNQKYWRRIPVLGLGPAAHSFDGTSRFANVRSLDGYLAALEHGEPPLDFCEVLSDAQASSEAIFLGLRTAEGVALDAVATVPRLDQKLAALDRDGLARVRDGRLRPTIRGLLVADRLPLLLT